MNPADDIWAKVIELMKQQGLSPTTIKTWFDDAKAVPSLRSVLPYRPQTTILRA